MSNLIFIQILYYCFNFKKIYFQNYFKVSNADQSDIYFLKTNNHRIIKYFNLSFKANSLSKLILIKIQNQLTKSLKKYYF